MNALILTVIVITLTLQNVFKKAYTVKKKDTFGFNALFGGAAALVFIIYAKGHLEYNRDVMPYIITFAVCFIICIFSSFMAVKTGSLSLTSLVGSYSLIIPTVYGIIFLNNPTSLLFYIGIALLVISLFLVNFEKGEKKITKKWLFYIAVTFIANGLCSTIQNLQQVKFNGQYKGEFMFTVYVAVLIVTLTMSLIFEKQTVKERFNKYSFLAISCGIANGVANLLVMVMSTRIAGSVLFPVISGGNILATAAVSYLFYKERLSKQQLLGVLLGTASIICLNIK